MASTFDPSMLQFGLRPTPHLWSLKPDARILKDLKLPQPKMEFLERYLERALQWWNSEPDDASKQIHRVCVAMGLEPQKLSRSTSDHDEMLISMVTVALTCSL